jgi:hypothetical protein
MELAFVGLVALAIIFTATVWGMAYGWQRGWEEARQYYWRQWDRETRG